VRYVVTGAAGFIGSHLCEALLREGHELLAVDCFTPYYEAVRKEENIADFDVVRLDLAEEELKLDRTDGIFHLAGQPGVRSFGPVFADYVRHNVLATQRVFDAAARAGVRVVFASSSSVYGDAERYPTPEDAQPQPVSPYGVTKLACEHLAHAYVRNFALDVVTLRYFVVYGPRQRPDMAFTRLVEVLAAGGTFGLYGDGSQSRSFTYVDDAVAATAAAMDRAPSGAVYNVGGGTEATLNHVIELLESISGHSLNVRRLPLAAGDVGRTCADTTRIRCELGWQPRVELEEGLRAQWQWASRRVSIR
jgi:UDP-glucuronate 4-epimerase